MVATKVTNKNRDLGTIKLIWIPCHAGIKGNELAYVVATAHATYQYHPDSEASLTPDPVAEAD